MKPLKAIPIKPYGGDGGKEFEMLFVKEIGLRTGKYVDQIRINGITFGKDGGKDKGSICLDADEYINKVEIRSKKCVDYVKFTTNKNSSIGGGGKGGLSETLENIRVIGIGGRYGQYVDKLSIKYINDYKPSEIVEEQAGFILSFSAPGQTFFEYSLIDSKKINSYKTIATHMFDQKYSVSVEAEYYAKVSASVGFEIKDSNVKEVEQRLSDELTKYESTKTVIKEDHVGILLANGSLMKAGGEDKYWMFPTSNISYSIIKISESDNVLNHYDLTGELHTQMPALKKHMAKKNGYVFYEE